MKKTPRPPRDPHWDQSAFEEMQAKKSQKRIAEDEKRLQRIFDLAESSPTLKQALEWAKAHDVKFFIDRKAQNLGGYYQQGTGVLAVVSYGHTYYPEENHADDVETLTHELRHAWQDYYGLMSKGVPWTFTAMSIKEALIEADAFAFGKRAQYEFCESLGIEMPIDDGKPWWQRPELGADLGQNFLAWFDLEAGWYGANLLKVYSKFYNIRGASAASHDLPKAEEFKKAPPTVRRIGVSITDMQDLLRLGRGFSGTDNYLAELQPDILPKKILRPSLANTFWGAAAKEEQKVATKLRKIHLRKKLAHRLPQVQS